MLLTAYTHRWLPLDDRKKLRDGQQVIHSCPTMTVFAATTSKAVCLIQELAASGSCRSQKMPLKRCAIGVPLVCY